MDHHSIEVTIRDVTISNRNQKKLKKLKDLEDATYWSYYMNEDKVEKWLESALLEQDLKVIYDKWQRVHVYSTYHRNISLDQLRLFEKALGVKCDEISVSEKNHLCMQFSLDPKDHKPAKVTVPTKDQISMIPQKGVKRVIYV
jgi:hypothetical protein